MPSLLSNFSTVDIILVIFFILSFCYGAHKGFISLASPFIAVFLSFNTFIFFRPIILKYFGIYFQNKLGILLTILILIILYAIFRIILSKIESILKGFLKAVFLRWIDRVCGGLASIFIVSIFIFILFLLIRELIYPTRNIQDIFNSKIIDFLVITVRKVGIFSKMI